MRSKVLSAKLAQAEVNRPMDFNKAIRHAVAAVIIVLIITYAAGWFGGAPAPAPRP